MSIYTNPATSIVVGGKNVTSAATPLQLTTTATDIAWVVITARPANTGKIAVGDSTVLATAGSEKGAILSAGATLVLPLRNLATVYIDATVSGEGVSFLYGKNST